MPKMKVNIERFYVENYFSWGATFERLGYSVEISIMSSILE